MNTEPQNRAGTEVSLADRRYRTLAEAAFEGVAVVEDGEIVDLNDQLVDILGYSSRDQLLGESIEAFIPQEDVALVREQIRRSVDTGVATLEQQRCICRDGTVILAELRGKILPEQRGDSSILVVRDISDWKRAEQELEKAYVDLEQFTRIASHDLRAPLRAVDNLSQWIVEDLGDDIPAESANHLELLRARVQRMERLLEDLLRYARAGGKDTKLERVDVAELIEDAVEGLIIPEGIAIEIGSDLPVFETAWAPLKQVFANLISNAVQHHDRDEGVVCIAAESDDDQWVFSVSDDGPGIPPKYHDKIFEVFHTLEAPSKAEGTGMGLSLVQRLVESAGGRITIETNAPEERGTTFQFTWPRRWKDTY